MKPETNYNDIVMGSFIEDVIGDIVCNMQFVEITDPYFEQLSIEKFTLEHLLREISESGDTPPTEIVERLIRKLDGSVCDSQDPIRDDILSISRDTARSLLMFYL